MGLKKNFFKRLQGGVNHSPLKFHDGTKGMHGLDKKKVNIDPKKIVKEVAQDKLRVNNNFSNIKNFKTKQDIKSALDNEKRNQVNIDFRKNRLSEMKKLYPKASNAELEAYLFSNKPGLAPDASSKNFGFTNANYGQDESLFDTNLTNPNFPSDATAKTGYTADAYAGHIHDPRDSGNFLFGLNNEEKRKAISDSIKNLELDTRDPLENYQYQSLNKFADWFNNDITRKRMLEQFQHSGNIRQSNFLSSQSGKDKDGNSTFNTLKDNPLAKPGQENVAGSLYSEADIDNVLSSLKDKSFHYGDSSSGGYISSQNLKRFRPKNEISYFNQEKDYPRFGYDNNGKKISTNAPDLNKLFSGRHSDIDAVMSVNDDIYINPEMVNASFRPINDQRRFNESYDRQDFDTFLSQDDIRDIMASGGITNFQAAMHGSESPSRQNFSKAVGGHELTHSTGFDMAGDPYLRSILEINPKNKDRVRNYNTSPGELYANFHELRLHLGMEPGEQWDSEKLNKRLEERGSIDQSNFLNNFTEESLIEALNKVADVDKNDNGKIKFDVLKSQGQNNNYEMNA